METPKQIIEDTLALLDLDFTSDEEFTYSEQDQEETTQELDFN